MLGSASNHHTIANGRCSYCVCPFGSGQQLIFEERCDEDGTDLVASQSADADASAGATGAATGGAEPDTEADFASAPRQRPGQGAQLIFYVQSREAFRVAFMAAAAKHLLAAGSIDWTDVEARAEFVVRPALDAMGIARLGERVALCVRTITHAECPRGYGRRCGAGRLPGGFGAPARERLPAGAHAAAVRAAAGGLSGRWTAEGVPAAMGRVGPPKGTGTASFVARKRRASGAGLPR